MSDLISCGACGLVNFPHTCTRTTPFKLTPQPALGWKCPVCGAGNAPTTARCNCVPTGPVPTPIQWPYGPIY